MRTLQQHEEWSDRAEWEVLKSGDGWQVIAWRVEHPEAKGSVPPLGVFDYRAGLAVWKRLGIVGRDESWRRRWRPAGIQKGGFTRFSCKSAEIWPHERRVRCSL